MCGKITGLDDARPVLQLGAAAVGEQRGERADVLDQDRQVGAGEQQLVEVGAVGYGQVRWAGHDPGHQPPRRRDRPLGIGAALVEVQTSRFALPV